ncbi:10188_t:CDS:1 [Ambispora gerdemannii]|uniref:10188_t:CDS:1 n=1 Tax=Ambispora gerdemannii TaxID=144530 RepID=A0A9N9CBW6_9GLOM|nr:10188_t:CDS:1 [Ambispora gerdemannii]
MTKLNTNYKYLTDNERQILQQCPYQLTLSINELTKSAVKKRHNPPRPQNSWVIFRRDYEAHLRLCNQNIKSKVKETAKECSLKWRKLSSEVKYFFKILEKIACENHKRTYPNYKYKPKHAKNSSHKEFIFREEKKYVSISSTKFCTITSNSPQETIQIDGPPFLTFNSPQETIKINGPPSLTSNSPQEPILPSLTLAISTAIYNNQDDNNNFMTAIYNQQDYTTIYNQQDYDQQDYTNDLAQNSLDNVFNNDKLNHNDNQLPIFFAEGGESYMIDINNDNNDIFSAPNTSNTPITSLISSPLMQSQLFMTKYDLCPF